MVVRAGVEYLTFGQTRRFVFSSLAGLGAFAVTFVGREVVISVPENETVVIWASVGLGLIFACGTVWALSSLGTLTYCPRFHQPRAIVISLVLYVLVALVLVAFGYAVFIFTVVGRVPATAAELAVGGVFVSFVAFALAAAHYGGVRREQDPRRKKQVIDDFVEAVEAVSSCDRSEISDHTDSLCASLQELEQCLRDEPVAECDELRETVAQWRREFGEATDSGARKLVDASVVGESGAVVDLDPYWEAKRTKFRQFHNDLHVMRDSALHKLDPRHG